MPFPRVKASLVVSQDAAFDDHKEVAVPSELIPSKTRDRIFLILIVYTIRNMDANRDTGIWASDTF